MTSVVIEKSQEKDIHSSETLQKLTLEQFLNLPETDESYELVDGEAIKKMSPKFFHSRLTRACHQLSQIKEAVR